MSLERILELLNKELFKLGDASVTPATLLQFVLIIAVVIVAGRLTRRFLRDRVLKRTALDPGARDAIGRISGYAVVVLGAMVGLSTLGLDLSALAVLGGALGVGIGFGLQNIVNNFVSGLIILFERPITVGHRVEVGGTTGVVRRIGARSTSVVTNDNITHIIPNSEFVSQPVINWSHGNDRRVRISVPIGVSYGSNPREVERLLLDVASKNENVIQEMNSDVLFVGFGESSIDFQLRVWSETLSGTPHVLQSQLLYAAWDVLQEAGIEIPFPQRDLNFRNPVRVEMSSASGPSSGT